MILHYLTTSFRSLERRKMSTFIHVLGLSTGMAGFSLFLLYAVNEFSYDRFHLNGKNIYRVYDWWSFPDRRGTEPSSATPIGPAMKNDVADVRDFVRIQGTREMLIRIESEIQKANMMFADPQILSVFTFPLLAGDSAQALRDPNSVVLTRSTALRFFGTTQVLGRPIEIREDGEYKTVVVTGVAEDIPANSTLRFDVLASLDRVLNTPLGQQSSIRWTMTLGISTYVLLQPGSQLMSEPKRLASFRKKYFPTEGADLRVAGLWDGKGVVPAGYGLQPLENIHTGVDIDRSASDPNNIWILITISGGVLAIACINFVILSIASSAGRSKEVAVRKVTGSRQSQLIAQFLTESMVLTLASTFVGLAIAQLLLPLFNDLTGGSIRFSVERYPELVGLVAATALLTGLAAGSYPAFMLSSFRPVDALKKHIRLAGSNFFTKSLITFQFGLSVALITAMIVIVKQLHFMQSKDLGFDQEGIMAISVQNATAYEEFRRLLDNHTAIAGITGSLMGLGAGEGQMGRAYDFDGKAQGVIEYPVDANFLTVMDMKLVAGRNFNPQLTSDTLNAAIVNETLVSEGLGTTPEQALGMQLRSTRGDQPARTIIGVVRDFHFEALTRQVRPQMFVRPSHFTPSAFFVRLRNLDHETIESVRAAWKKAAPDLPFTYSFLDEKFDSFYKKEERWARITAWAGNICIVLACMGLFGMVSLATANRTKEIGIRKVLGASAAKITALLCTDSAKLVTAGIAIASPLAFYGMAQWLGQFAYRIELTWLIPVLAALLVVTVAMLTVGIQAVRAAMADPVKSLRSE